MLHSLVARHLGGSGPLASDAVIVVTNRSKAMVLMWFSVACFGVGVSVVFHLLLVQYTFSSV